MRMDSCLILLCLFVFVETSTAAVSLRCNQTVFLSGPNLTVQCQFDSSRHHVDCWAKPDMLTCKCGSKRLVCKMEPPLKNGRIEHLSVVVEDATIGTCTISLDYTTCGEENVQFPINVTKALTKVADKQTDPPETDVIGTAVGCVMLVAVVIIVVIIAVTLRIRKHRSDKSTTAELL